MDKNYFEQKKREIAEFRQKMSDEGKKFFSDMSAELFGQYPELISFSWTQYTPYFNDGDPCTFSSNAQYPSIKMDGQEDDEDDEGYFTDKDETADAVVWRAIKSLLSQFDDADFEMLFGDHVRVTVKREGVEVEEYSHD